jgi:3-phenylpropionate/trans-cinnamate dioxygenase ferredoxin subunit
MPTVKLTVAKNGPLRVSDPNGEVELIDSEGNPVTPANPNSFSICRCGASAKKPFCDGTHSKIGFEKAAEAVPESRE